MILTDTIVAPITPIGSAAAVAVLRLTGPEAFSILKTLIKRDPRTLEERKTYHLKLYRDRQKSQLLDDAVITLYRGRRSFCGEDTVEFAVHGSPLIANELIERCLAAGARLAERGEFSLKAVLNGKMKLLEAEQMNAVIHAPTARALGRAQSSYASGQNTALNALAAESEYLLAYALQVLDYPEEYTDEEEQFCARLVKIEAETTRLIEATRANEMLFQGVRTAIVGAPNAGKSTLLNALLCEDKAIVSPLAGTTRDIVEGQRVIGGVLFHFFDTAGIRNSADPIERQGINKSREAIRRADIVLELSEDGTYLEDFDGELQSWLADKLVLRLRTKADISSAADERSDLSIAALNGDMGSLEKLLLSKLGLADLDCEGLFSARDRQKLSRFSELITAARRSIIEEKSYDLAAVNLQSAQSVIKELQGLEFQTEEIYDAIFSNFCVGK